jgi:putative transposase
MNETINIIEIKFINDCIKICYSYENNKSIDNSNLVIDYEKSISIDLGVKNLMVIHDPTSTQHIVKGNMLISTNFHYNKLIGDAQKHANWKEVKRLNFKRSNIINNFFNQTVKWMSDKYSNKSMIVIGYNKGWKTGINIGRLNNFKFYKIPYCQLINKIKEKFTNMGIVVHLIEESYTSKCDSLAYEEICKHDEYLGKRSKRGLFESSNDVLINADLNGAINIMRKVFDITKVIGEKIFNPITINIFREARQRINVSVHRLVF